MKKSEFIKSYVNGKKSAFYNIDGQWWLLSYTKGWGYWKDDIPFKNRKGFFAAEELSAFDIESATRAAEELHGGPVYLEGSDEYNKIREDVESKARKPKKAKKLEPAAIAEPVEPAPVIPEPLRKIPVVTKIDGTGKHAQFVKICKSVRAGLDVYLYGPAGTGKSYLARQVAEELGLDFYPQSAINDKFELEGGQDPRNGSSGYIETAFYKAFKYGGLFLLDEADASDNTQLIALNNALADRRYCFPVVGIVEAHPNFRFMATGNTAGRGADASYNTRQAQDAAFLNRFALRTKINYDLGIEMSCAKNDAQLVEFGHELRKALADIRCADAVFTYRNISMIKKLTTENEFGDIICTIREALEDNFFCALNPDTIKAIAERVNIGGRYNEALREIAEAV